MKERPSLFSTPMVQAIDREIDPKWQTRRILKDVPDWIEKFGFNELTPKGCISGFGDFKGSHAQKFFKSPYGVAGDRLWVRETWRPKSWGEDFDWMMIEYKAGGSVKQINPIETWDDFRCQCLQEQLANESLARGGSAVVDAGMIHSILPEKGLKWRPSIFMPRNACRTLLEITSIRVEKLMDITDEDAIAEGATYFPDIPLGWGNSDNCRWSMEGNPKDTAHCLASPRLAFLNYWDQLNKKRGFGIETKPWVWVVSFKKAEAEK
jgi:hypothetical protein